SSSGLSVSFYRGRLASERAPVHPLLHSFPTRRSSDLSLSRTMPAFPPECGAGPLERTGPRVNHIRSHERGGARPTPADTRRDVRDRKSTRLNSSHVKISYAVFCLKKKSGVCSLHPPSG